MQHSSELLEIVISDLQQGGTYTEDEILYAIRGLFRVIDRMKKEELDSL